MISTTRRADGRNQAGRAGVAGALAVLLLVAGSTVAGAAASKSSSSTQQWANGVCSALSDFGSSVRSTLDGLKSASSLDEAAQDAVQGVQQATDDLQKSLDDLGKPPTTGAKQAQNAIKNLGDELSADVDDVKAALQPPPSSPQEIASAFAQIGTIVQTGVNQTRSTLTSLQDTKSSKSLRAAFKNAPACTQVRKSS